MRAASVAALISVVAGQTASSTTTTNYANAMQACTQTSMSVLQTRQDCAAAMGSMAGLFSNNTDLGPFCSSPCYGVMRSAYVGLGLCMQNYKPTLTANLQADGVANPAALADSMIGSSDLFGSYFDYFCLKNERGDYCFPLYIQMSLDIASSASGNSSTSVTDTICRYYYNGGCCLPSIDLMYTTRTTANSSFSTSLARMCPALANFAPPPCVAAGRTATALSVSMTLTGLSCATYLAQTADVRAQYEAALKLDLASQGISANFITINTIKDQNGQCTVNVLLRAGTDAATNDLKTAASTMNSASLTNSNQVLSTASAGSVSALGSATVSSTTVTGTSADSSPSSIAVPSMALLGAFLVWLA